MPKVKYDVSNVDDAGGFEHVQPGMYIGKVTEINLKESKSGNGPMFEVILQPVKTADGKAIKPKDKKKQIARVYTYVLLEHDPSDWKLKEFTKAFSLKDKGTIDTDKLVGKQVQMNLKSDTDLEDRYRPRVGKLLAMPGDAKASDDNGASAKVAEPDAEDDDELYTSEDLEAMEDDELIEAADEFDIKPPKGRMTPSKRKKLVMAILDSQEGDEEEDEDDEAEDEDESDNGTAAEVEDEADEDEADEEDDDEDEEDDEEEDDEEEDDEEPEAEEEDLEDTLGALDRKGLKEYIKDNNLDVTVKKSMEDEDIREAITEAVAPEDEVKDEDVDYTSWSMDALKKETQERGLSAKGSKKILAGRLSKDDEDDDNPF